MLMTTTPILEGKEIKEYKGVVFHQVVRGTGFGRTLGAGFKQLTGGRSAGHQELIEETRETALAEFKDKAAAMGANAIVGVTIDYEMLTQDTLILCKLAGTAVVI